MTMRPFAKAWRCGVEVGVSVYRVWQRNAYPIPDTPTYRYAGVVLQFSPVYRANGRWRWNAPRIGRHVDDCGRVYLYLGWVYLWQDMRPGRRDWRAHFQSHRTGPLEIVEG